MSTRTTIISRKLVEAGIDKKAADAIAQQIAAQPYIKDAAVKEYIAELEACIVEVRKQLKVINFWLSGTLVGIVVIIILQLSN